MGPLAIQKQEEAERAALEELKAADAWLEWSRNQCGKSNLNLLTLQCLPKRLRSREELKGVNTKGVALNFEAATSDRDKEVAGDMMNAAIKCDPKFPQPFAYFQGMCDSDRFGEGQEWFFEVYARGEPLPLLPEPPKPAFLNSPD